MHARVFIHSADAKRASVATKGRFISPRGVLLAALKSIFAEGKDILKFQNFKPFLFETFLIWVQYGPFR